MCQGIWGDPDFFTPTPVKVDGAEGAAEDQGAIWVKAWKSLLQYVPDVELQRGWNSKKSWPPQFTDREYFQMQQENLFEHRSYVWREQKILASLSC